MCDKLKEAVAAYKQSLDDYMDILGGKHLPNLGTENVLSDSHLTVDDLKNVLVGKYLEDGYKELTGKEIPFVVGEPYPLDCDTRVLLLIKEVYCGRRV